MRLDVTEATIERVADGVRLQGSPLPEFVLEILRHGGLMNKLVADGYVKVVAGLTGRW